MAQLSWLASSPPEYANTVDQKYLTILDRILSTGEDIKTRNGIRRTIYNESIRIPMFPTSFPLLTCRRIPPKNPIVEMCWFLRGDQDVSFLHNHNVSIWDKNAVDGTVGRAYGYQWRYGFDVDQIERCIQLLRTDPTSTRNIVSAWNPTDLDDVVLPPCHVMFQVHSNGSRFHLQVSMRSTDWILGAPTNIAEYAVLGHLLAAVSGQTFFELSFNFGNIHVYDSHIDGAMKLLHRTDLNQILPSPRLLLPEEIDETLWEIDPRQFSVLNYHPNPFPTQFEMIV